MKIKTNELQGVALDWAVAQCEYFPVRYGFDDNCPEYSTNWAQGGPIIERENISVFMTDERWEAYASHSLPMNFSGGDGEDVGSPLVAAMRCYVASNLGEEVEIPEELS